MGSREGDNMKKLMDMGKSVGKRKLRGKKGERRYMHVSVSWKKGQKIGSN